MNEWLIGALGILAVLVCPAMMLVALLRPRLPWRRLAPKTHRADSETQA